MLNGFIALDCYCQSTAHLWPNINLGKSQMKQSLFVFIKNFNFIFFLKILKRKQELYKRI